MTDDQRQWMQPASEDVPAETPGPDPAPGDSGTASSGATPGAPVRVREASYGPPSATAAQAAPADRPAGVAPSTAGAARRRTLLIAAGVAVAVTVAVGVVIASRSSSGQPSAAAVEQGATATVTTKYELPGDRRQRLTAELAQRRAAALTAGDEAAWLADIDPGATQVIAREKMRFANLRQLQMTSFSFHPDDYDNAFFAETDRTTGQVRVGEIMRLAEDVTHSESIATWTIAFDGNRATITGIDPAGAEKDPYHSAFYQAPWDDVPLRSARGAGVTIFAPVGSRWDPKTYLPGAERAVKLVRSVWRNRLGTPGFLVFLADPRQFETWFANGADRGDATGVTYFAPMVEANGLARMAHPNPTVIHKANEPSWIQRSAGGRIVLDMHKIGSVRAVQGVIAHEMAHAIAPHLIETTRGGFGPKGDTMTNQAIWPIEGFARWMEFLDDPGYGPAAMRAVRAGKAKYRLAGSFPDSENFYAKDAGRTSFNYNLSASMFLAAERTGGRQKAADLYVCLASQFEGLSSDEMFLGVCLKGVGLNPDKVWSVQHQLTR